MKRKKTRTGFSVFGYIVYFAAIAAVVTAAMLTYGLIADKGLGRGPVAGIMLACIFFLSLVCTAADIVRRRLMVDRPVKKILDAADRIACGDFSVRLEPSHIYSKYNAYDEIMENLNRMAAALSQTEVLRTDFIANVSHEFKTPLAVIQNYAAALRGEGLSAEERREYADTVASSAKRLSALMANILKLNKLEHQEILPDFRSVELGELLRGSVLGFEEEIDRKGIELDCEIEDVTAVADPGFLEVIWNNLLSNAVKFTPEGGRIGVTLKDEGVYAAVTIRDTGCGMTAETGSHIFEKFYQGDTSHSGEGNGLGLALVKKVIDVIGGQISVESELGRGSAFTVRLKKEGI